MNNDTLLYWHKLENFYPYILEEQHNEKIKSFKIARECDYPDLENPTIQENNCVRYYEVYLGIFRVKSALDVIAKQMNAEKEFRDDSNETSCFCKFRLKADGKFDETSFRISSFPWAINRVKQKQIELNQWDDDFHEYEKRLFMQLFAWDEVVDYEKCRQIVNRIKSELSWNIEFSGCWMRIDRVVGEKKDNQSQEHTAVVEEEDRQIDELIKANDLLNSFYVRDLENVINNVSKQNYGQALEQYLNHNSDKRIDVEHDKDALFAIFDPKTMPYGKWPSGYSLRRMQRNISEKERKLRAVRKRLSKLYMEKGEAEKSVQELEMQRLQMQKQKDEIRQQVLFFKIRYWICPKNEMIVAYKNIEKKENKCLHEKFEKQEKIRILIKLIKEKEDTEKQYGKEIEEQKQKIELQNQQIDNFKKEYDEYVPDDDYLMKLTESEKAQEYKTAQEKAPWNGKEINKLRETLFLEAMNLQRAFVENSSQMRDQLDAFSKMMRGNLSSTQLDKYAASLFQGFALAVPVISSTFASIGSFLRYVGREDIGLVLADESGQAMPQAAAGVIWRCRRVIAVGDPLQIEPVVTIHDKTIEFLKNYYKQSAFVASKTTSVQSLADAANNYIGIRELDGTNFYVGSPLLVHGRCQKRIFDIANIIAYNETMIYNTVDREESVCAWIDVKGQSQNKHFVLEQAKRILPIIKNEFIASWNKNGKSEIPSLFIISPFRNVKAGLASYYRDNDFLYHNICESNDVECKQNIKDWIRDNIGTIHTFQGKEADTVIICLGVDSGEKENGAVEWACGRPNILNVAVTRAKNNLYIVGDADKWASKPYFSTAYELCEKYTNINFFNY